MSKLVNILILLTVISGLIGVYPAHAKSYPKDGKFKALHYTVDNWYHIDKENWYIKAPDKWVHFMGSYAMAEIGFKIIGNKLTTGAISLGLGLLKEYDDGYREGWSQRDIYMDVSGTLSSLLMPDNMKFLCYYDDRSIIFKFTVLLDK